MADDDLSAFIAWAEAATEVLAASRLAALHAASGFEGLFVRLRLP